MASLDRLISETPGILGKLFAFEDIGGMVKMTIIALGVATHYIFNSPSELQSAAGAAILITLDTLTGLMVAFKTGRPRTSAKLSRILTKVFGYMAVAAVASVCKKALLWQVELPLVDGILLLVIATEGLSILENVDALGVGKFPALKKILGTVAAGENEAVDSAHASEDAAIAAAAAAKEAVAASKIASTKAEEAALSPNVLESNEQEGP